MKKILVFCLLFSFSHTTFGAEQKAISPEAYQTMAPILDSLYQKLRNDTLPKLQTPSLAECKKYFNMKDERLRLPAKISKREELMTVFMSSLFNMDEVSGNIENISEKCRPLFQTMFESAMNFDFTSF